MIAYALRCWISPDLSSSSAVSPMALAASAMCPYLPSPGAARSGTRAISHGGGPPSGMRMLSASSSSTRLLPAPLPPSFPSSLSWPY